MRYLRTVNPVRSLRLLMVMLAGIVIAVLVLVVMTLQPVYRPGTLLVSDALYERQRLPISSYDLFDLGVADINGDPWLDIFTVNHSASQVMLAGQGDGHFDAQALAGLFPQDASFIGLEDSLQAPVLDAPGLYIYRVDRWLMIKAHELESSASFQGQLSMPWRLSLDEQASSLQAVDAWEPGDRQSLLRFTLRAGQVLRLNGDQDIVELPHRIELADDTDLTRVFVGRALTNPPTTRFTLHWRDRHAMAFTDLNDDGVSDVFIARGGVKGQLGSIDTSVRDELLISDASANDNSLRIDRIQSSNIRKKGCPARQASWVDANGDGRLDLHIVCSRLEPHFPDQLWQQGADDKYIDKAQALGLDHPGRSVGAWADLDGDGDADFLAAQDGWLNFHENTATGFVRQAVVELGDDEIGKVALGDYDNDGDLDAFVAGLRVAWLVQREPDGWLALSPEDSGLPGSGTSAQWVDHDNDGDLDLHVLPQGLYQQKARGQFVRTGTLAFRQAPESLAGSMCSWFDANADGALDVACGLAWFPMRTTRAWLKLVEKRTSALLTNVEYQLARPTDEALALHHWLHLDLLGTPGNRAALGARVQVLGKTGEQLRVIGQSEGSQYSQGHHRVYFGLGAHPEAVQVKVVWPDGTEQQLDEVATDQQLQIVYPSRLSADRQ